MQRVSFGLGEKWIYAINPKKNYRCIENHLYIGDKEIKLDKPILEVSADWYIAVRTKNRIYIYDFNGNEIFYVKAKSSSVCQKENYLTYSKKKKVEIIDVESEDKIFSKKVKSIINSVYANKEKIILGTSKGLLSLDYDKNVLWEVDVGNIDLIGVKDIIVGVTSRDVLATSTDGEVLWRYNIGDLVYDVEIQENVKIYTLNKGLFVLSKTGELENVEELHYEYKFLPLPDKISNKIITDLKLKLKKAKVKDVKNVKKMYKNAKKLLKGEKYGAAYTLALRAMNALKTLQFQINVPKRVPIGKQFFITLKFFNFFNEPIENIIVDLSDLEKYFEIQTPLLELPPIRAESYLERKIGAYPKYEGKFYATVFIKSNIGDFKKSLSVEVKRRRFIFFKEKRKSLLDLLERS